MKGMKEQSTAYTHNISKALSWYVANQGSSCHESLQSNGQPGVELGFSLH